jgi:hypothetical protein
VSGGASSGWSSPAHGGGVEVRRSSARTSGGRGGVGWSDGAAGGGRAGPIVEAAALEAPAGRSSCEQRAGRLALRARDGVLPVVADVRSRGLVWSRFGPYGPDGLGLSAGWMLSGADDDHGGRSWPVPEVGGGWPCRVGSGRWTRLMLCGVTSSDSCSATVVCVRSGLCGRRRICGGG